MKLFQRTVYRLISDCRDELNSYCRIKRYSGHPVVIAIGVALCLTASLSLKGQQLAHYSYTPYGTTWATYWYPQDNGLGFEVDSGTCLASPTVIQNQVSYQSGLGQPINYPIFSPPILTDGQGIWLLSTAQFVGTPSLFPIYQGISHNISGRVTSTFKFALSQAGIMTITETGSIALSPGFSNQITGTEYWSGLETINLNTGQDTWHFSAHESGTGANSCTSTGDLVASLSFSITVSLYPTTPTSNSLAFTNPGAANGGQVFPLPSTVDQATAANAPQATALSADGRSAAVVVYESTSTSNVTFSLSALSNSSSADIGTLTSFQPTYLSQPTAGASIAGFGQQPIIQIAGARARRAYSWRSFGLLLHCHRLPRLQVLFRRKTRLWW